RRGQGGLPQLRDRLRRLHPERLAVLAVDLATLKRHRRGDDVRRPATRVAGEDEFFAVVHAAIGREGVDVFGFLYEPVDLGPFDEAVELGVLLEDVEGFVVPAVLADEALPIRGRFGRRGRRFRLFGERAGGALELVAVADELGAEALDVVDDEV